jgi:hypothetical protein
MLKRNPVVGEYGGLNAAAQDVQTNSLPQERKMLKRSALLEWRPLYFRSHAELEAYNMVSGTRQVVAEVVPGRDSSTTNVADYMANSLNDATALHELVQHMALALEHCLTAGTLDWAAEHEADIMLRRAKKFLG